MHDAFLHLSASGHLCPLLMGTLMMSYLHHICSCSLSWRLSQKPLKSKFLSICHWQVFKMILRADTSASDYTELFHIFLMQHFWSHPYMLNDDESLNLFTKCRAPLIASDEQSNIFTSIPMNVISKFTGEKSTEWAYQSDLAHNITQ